MIHLDRQGTSRFGSAGQIPQWHHLRIQKKLGAIRADIRWDPCNAVDDQSKMIKTVQPPNLFTRHIISTLPTSTWYHTISSYIVIISHPINSSSSPETFTTSNSAWEIFTSSKGIDGRCPCASYHTSTPLQLAPRFRPLMDGSTSGATWDVRPWTKFKSAS